ncbi:hypothetical protein K6V92_16515 [Cupriavidus respiraculi]|uniref:hypothetical protein n=1 Tax=Cupriavidus respiraculi TaxID=195930 RepID=UPI001C961E8E|nr:hypothetical protein [Cupriavidus respiraculi]MBY4948220.1 hypothetical protein [Cupriavidus respiraculi]
MTAITVKRDAQARPAPDKAREPGHHEAESFGKLLGPRRRRAASGDDEFAQLVGLPLPFPGMWPLTAVYATHPSDDAACGRKSSTQAPPPPSVEAPAHAAAVEAAANPARPVGAELRLRFTHGAWAGLEMQAALHAGEIVVKLKPATRLQQKRLTEASAALSGQILKESGEAVQLEIADATR